MKCMNCGSEWKESINFSGSRTICPFCGKNLLPNTKKAETLEDVLHEISSGYGMEILGNGTKLLAYVSDLAPHLSAQRRLLGYFIECGGPNKIMAVQNATASEQTACVKKIISEMHTEMFLDEASARMICEAFLHVVVDSCNRKSISSPTNKEVQIKGNLLDKKHLFQDSLFIGSEIINKVEDLSENWEECKKEISANCILIAAENNDDGLNMALGVLKRFQRENNCKRAVVTISGNTLNKHRVCDVADRMVGKDVIIKEASSLSSTALNELKAILADKMSKPVIVLMDIPEKTDKFYANYANQERILLYLGISADIKIINGKLVERQEYNKWISKTLTDKCSVNDNLETFLAESLFFIMEADYKYMTVDENYKLKNADKLRDDISKKDAHTIYWLGKICNEISMSDKEGFNKADFKGHVLAKKWFDMSSELGNLDAMYMQGLYTILGLGEMESNVEKGLSIYRCAAEKGHVWSRFAYADTVAKRLGNRNEALYWYEKMIEEADYLKVDDNKELTSMTRRIMDTRSRRLKTENVETLFEKHGILGVYEAASWGNTDAIFYLGNYYETIELDKEKARAKYMQAAKYGNTDAMKRLSTGYRNGELGLEKSDEKARMWFERIVKSKYEG